MQLMLARPEQWKERHDATIKRALERKKKEEEEETTKLQSSHRKRASREQQMVTGAEIRMQNELLLMRDLIGRVDHRLFEEYGEYRSMSECLSRHSRSLRSGTAQSSERGASERPRWNSASQQPLTTFDEARRSDSQVAAEWRHRNVHQPVEAVVDSVMRNSGATRGRADRCPSVASPMPNPVVDPQTADSATFSSVDNDIEELNRLLESWKDLDRDADVVLHEIEPPVNAPS
jgi:hypothetical protein